MITAGVSMLFVLLAWPTGPNATGNAALEFGGDAGEFFALMLLSICGVFLVAGANDIILLFLGVELASFPTYIMVSISRPLPVAQEAGVKYFFLGAMSAAIMLFGFSYLYGDTGLTQLDRIMALWHSHACAAMPIAMTSWQLLAVLMLLAGLAFKIAAVPLHEYAGDVYQGAATPVTAFLAFIPKISGMVAIIKILYMVWRPEMGGARCADEAAVGAGGADDDRWQRARPAPGEYQARAGLQFGCAYRLYAGRPDGAAGAPEAQLTCRSRRSSGVLFYLAAYGIMNAGAFGVLMLLPARGTTRYGTPWRAR